MSSQPENDFIAFYLKKYGIFRVLKFEGISILATMFALCFTSGYVYLQIYYSRLGVPVERLGFESYAYAVYGGINILVVVTALFIAMTAVTLVTTALFFIENPDRLPQAKAANELSRRSIFKRAFLKRLKHAKDSILICLVTLLFALVFWLLWKVTVAQSVDRAEIAAFKEVQECNQTTVLLKSMDKVFGCLVAESTDMIYLVKKVSVSGQEVDFEKIMLLKSNVINAAGRSKLIKK